MRLTAAAEKGSEHPLGVAIIKAAERHGITLPAVTEFNAEVGRGVVCIVEGISVAVGNDKLMVCIGVDTKA